jgi:NTP pyrophosphatase (non-canonical NTP hydrolase)
MILKMERDERIKLYLRAIRNWGEEAQTDMVNEECGELITAIAQFKRGRTSHHDVMTELADVSIMVEQLATIMSYSDFEQEKDRKLERLRERLDKYEAKLVASQKEIMSQAKGEDGNNT